VKSEILQVTSRGWACRH